MSCQSRWVDPLTADEDDYAEATTGGPPITGDPVADCQQYQELTGRPDIRDAVAFTYNGDAIYVTPASDVPPDAVELPPFEAGPAFELKHSFSDMVDGGNSRCFNAAEALAFAKAEIARSGLTGWDIDSVATWRNGNSEGPCAWVGVDSEKPKIVIVVGTGGRNNSLPSEGDNPSMFTLRDALRDELATKCLSLPEAEAIVKRLLGAQHHWPTGTTLDEKAKCTMVDMVVGGSTQIFLRGPSATS